MRQLLAAAVVVVFSSPALSQQPPVKTTVPGVLIDVTVVDKQGHAVMDLTPDDFQLSEDGARQRLVSVTLVSGGVGRPLTGATPTVATPAQTEPVASPPPKAAAAPGTAETTLSVTAILFDRLSPESRPMARNAALAYLSTLAPPNDYAGVFLADLSLRTFQPFTNRQDGLRQAVQRVAATAPANLTADAELRNHPRVQDLDPSQPVTPDVESRAGWTTALEREKKLKGTDPDTRLRQMELRMWEGYRQFLSEYEGQATLAGLRAVVSGLSSLPGRKSVLYFTESLPITDRLRSRFDALIAEANRGNVIVYPVDAAGLRVHSKETEVAQNMSVAGSQGVGDAERRGGAWTKELERQAQVLSSRPTAVLGRLAKETGGFLIENTNDLAAGVARMQQERTTYYLIGYQPTNTKLDGTFRKVSVKVKRPKVTVRSRPGYVAAAVKQ